MSNRYYIIYYVLWIKILYFITDELFQVTNESFMSR